MQLLRKIFSFPGKVRRWAMKVPGYRLVDAVLGWLIKVSLLIGVTWAVILVAASFVMKTMTELNPFAYRDFIATFALWNQTDTRFDFVATAIAASAVIACFCTGIGFLRYGHEVDLFSLPRWFRRGQDEAVEVDNEEDYADIEPDAAAPAAKTEADTSLAPVEKPGPRAAIAGATPAGKNGHADQKEPTMTIKAHAPAENPAEEAEGEEDATYAQGGEAVFDRDETDDQAEGHGDVAQSDDEALDRRSIDIEIPVTWKDRVLGFLRDPRSIFRGRVATGLMYSEEIENQIETVEDAVRRNPGKQLAVAEKMRRQSQDLATHKPDLDEDVGQADVDIEADRIIAEMLTLVGQYQMGAKMRSPQVLKRMQSIGRQAYVEASAALLSTIQARLLDRVGGAARQSEIEAIFRAVLADAGIEADTAPAVAVPALAEASPEAGNATNAGDDSDAMDGLSLDQATTATGGETTGPAADVYAADDDLSAMGVGDGASAIPQAPVPVTEEGAAPVAPSTGDGDFDNVDLGDDATATPIAPAVPGGPVSVEAALAPAMAIAAAAAATAAKVGGDDLPGQAKMLARVPDGGKTSLVTAVEMEGLAASIDSTFKEAGLGAEHRSAFQAQLGLLGLPYETADYLMTQSTMAGEVQAVTVWHCDTIAEMLKGTLEGVAARRAADVASATQAADAASANQTADAVSANQTAEAASGNKAADAPSGHLPAPSNATNETGPKEPEIMDHPPRTPDLIQSTTPLASAKTPDVVPAAALPAAPLPAQEGRLEPHLKAVLDKMTALPPTPAEFPHNDGKTPYKPEHALGYLRAVTSWMDFVFDEKPGVQSLVSQTVLSCRGDHELTAAHIYRTDPATLNAWMKLIRVQFPHLETLAEGLIHAGLNVLKKHDEERRPVATASVDPLAEYGRPTPLPALGKASSLVRDLKKQGVDASIESMKSVPGFKEVLEIENREVREYVGETVRAALSALPEVDRRHHEAEILARLMGGNFRDSNPGAGNPGGSNPDAVSAKPVKTAEQAPDLDQTPAPVGDAAAGAVPVAAVPVAAVPVAVVPASTAPAARVDGPASLERDPAVAVPAVAAPKALTAAVPSPAASTPAVMTAPEPVGGGAASSAPVDQFQAMESLAKAINAGFAESIDRLLSRLPPVPVVATPASAQAKGASDVFPPSAGPSAIEAPFTSDPTEAPRAEQEDGKAIETPAANANVSIEAAGDDKLRMLLERRMLERIKRTLLENAGYDVSFRPVLVGRGPFKGSADSFHVQAVRYGRENDPTDPSQLMIVQVVYERDVDWQSASLSVDPRDPRAPFLRLDGYDLEGLPRHLEIGRHVMPLVRQRYGQLLAPDLSPDDVQAIDGALARLFVIVINDGEEMKLRIAPNIDAHKVGVFFTDAPDAKLEEIVREMATNIDTSRRRYVKAQAEAAA